MSSFTSVVAPSALIATISVYATPVALVRRVETCGTVPSGSGSQTPISSSTSTTTAEACQMQCNNESFCVLAVVPTTSNLQDLATSSTSTSSNSNNSNDIGAGNANGSK